MEEICQKKCSYRRIKSVAQQSIDATDLLAGSFVISSSYPGPSCRHCQPRQPTHPPTLLGLETIQYLRVSEGSKRFEKWAVSLSSLSSLVRKAHCLVPNTKTCHGWDFPKLLKVFGHLSLIAISKGLSGAQLTYASIHRQDHVVCRTRKVKGNCFRARIHSQ